MSNLRLFLVTEIDARWGGWWIRSLTVNIYDSRTARFIGVVSSKTVETGETQDLMNLLHCLDWRNFDAKRHENLCKYFLPLFAIFKRAIASLLVRTLLRARSTHNHKGICLINIKNEIVLALRRLLMYGKSLISYQRVRETVIKNLHT